MADPRNFLLNTDYPLDKVVYMDSGEMNLTGGGGAGDSLVFAHGLTFTPLLMGSWSLDSDFSTSKEFFLPTYEDTINGIYALAFSGDTNITINAIKYSAGADVLYWRLYAFMPPSVESGAAATSSSADNFILNTDYNYTKLYLNEYYDCSSGNQTITHNFGYRPQVEAWRADDPSIVFKENVSGYVEVTTTTIILTGGAGKKYYLRIYADSQV